jgi:hypothetical protein
MFFARRVASRVNTDTGDMCLAAGSPGALVSPRRVSPYTLRQAFITDRPRLRRSLK